MFSNEIVNLTLAFLVAFLVSILSTPIAKRIALKVGAIDIPKDNRRIHKEPIPRLGGLAIFFGFLVSFLVFSKFNSETLGLLLGACLIIAVGFVDDIKPLSAKIKLVFQIIAALIVVYSGVEIKAITNPFAAEKITSLDFYGISIVITVLWIVGVTNAINFIDGLDGLAAGVSSIAALFLLFIGLINGKPTEVLLMAILAGSTLGFLPYNFNPAKIFMGDTGSTFLGFVLAVISIQGTMKGYAAIAILVPLMVLGLPIFDTAFAILRRMLKGKPVMQADRGHLHHRLIDAGYTQKQSVLMLYAISIILGVSALVIVQTGLGRALIIVAVVLALIFLSLKYFINLHSREEERID